MRSLLLSLMLIAALFLNAQQSKQIAEAFKAGNAVSLTNHFSSSVELNLPKHKGIFQKDQAKMILKEFFELYPPKSFELKHKGGSERKSRFEIGKLKSGPREFRTYLFYNSVGGNVQIIELRIEEE